MTNKTTEQLIQEKGLTAPRVTPQDLQNLSAFRSNHGELEKLRMKKYHVASSAALISGSAQLSGIFVYVSFPQ